MLGGEKRTAKASYSLPTGSHNITKYGERADVTD